MIIAFLEITFQQYFCISNQNGQIIENIICSSKTQVYFLLPRKNDNDPSFLLDNVVQLCVFYRIYQCNNDIIFSNFLKICQSSIISQMIAKISFCTILQKILFAPMTYPLIKSPFVLLSNFLPGNLISAKNQEKELVLAVGSPSAK